MHNHRSDPLPEPLSAAGTGDNTRNVLDLRHRAEALSRTLLMESDPHYAPNEENIFRLELAFSERHRPTQG